MGEKIRPLTQRRIVSQVGHFLDWTVHEGQITNNPFKTVRVEAKGRSNHYEAMTDEAVLRLPARDEPRIGGYAGLHVDRVADR